MERINIDGEAAEQTEVKLGGGGKEKTIFFFPNSNNRLADESSFEIRI